VPAIAPPIPALPLVPPLSPPVPLPLPPEPALPALDPAVPIGPVPMLESQPAPVASSSPTAIIAEPQKVDLVMATFSGDRGVAREPHRRPTIALFKIVSPVAVSART
jgi:hypothetical protein